MLLWTLLAALLLPASAALADAGEEAPACRDETPLSQAAGELLLQAKRPSSDALTAAVRAAGSDLVGVRAYYYRRGERGAQQWLAQVERDADAALVCGFAQTAETRLLLVAVRAGSLDALSAGSTRVRGALAAGFRDPELVISDGQGALQRIKLDRAALERGVPVSEALPRPALVQLLARGPSGPRPLAERVLPAERGEPPAAAGASPQPPPAAGGDAEPDVAALLSELRAEQARPALRDNALLARVAAEHATRVCQDGRVAHELTPGENPQRRLREAGVQAQRVGETVARAPSIGAAFTAFEHSPSHRLTLLERGFTDAGVGQAADAQGRHCVVILLAAWPRFVGR